MLAIGLVWGISWHWAFALLVPGPLLGIVAMLRLGARPVRGVQR